jgi:sugar phosphate isomerase/epimerase
LSRKIHFFLYFFSVGYYTAIMIQIGLRAHDYGCLPPEELAAILSSYGVDSIQLALVKAFRDPPAPGCISPGYARRIRKILEERNLAVAVLGCYINPVHPDREEREKSLRLFEEHLRFARDFGCPLVGTETGSLNPDCSWHPGTGDPEVFDTLCFSVERLLKTAERCGSMAGIEAVADRHTVSSIEKMAKLLERFSSPSLGVIYDPVNLIPESGLEESQESFFRRALDAFGDKIMAVHLKDFRMEGGKKIGDLPAGTGELDWPCLLGFLKERRPGVDLLLENSDPKRGRETIRFIRKKAGEC